MISASYCIFKKENMFSRIRELLFNVKLPPQTGVKLNSKIFGITGIFQSVPFHVKGFWLCPVVLPVKEHGNSLLGAEV